MPDVPSLIVVMNRSASAFERTYYTPRGTAEIPYDQTYCKLEMEIQRIDGCFIYLPEFMELFSEMLAQGNYEAHGSVFFPKKYEDF